MTIALIYRQQQIGKVIRAFTKYPVEYMKNT